MLLRLLILWLVKLDISGVVSLLSLERIRAGEPLRKSQQMEARVQELCGRMVLTVVVLLPGQ